MNCLLLPPYFHYHSELIFIMVFLIDLAEDYHKPKYVDPTHID